MIDRLQALDVSNATSEFRIPVSASERLVLKVAHAGKDHKAYWNDSLGKSSAFDSLAQKGGGLKKNKVDPNIVRKLLEEQDERSVELYAKHIIRDWWMEVHEDGVWTRQPATTKEGEPFPFSRENASALMSAMPGHVLDDLRSYCDDVTNFYDVATPEEQYATVKNS